MLKDSRSYVKKQTHILREKKNRLNAPILSHLYFKDSTKETYAFLHPQFNFPYLLSSYAICIQVKIQYKTTAVHTHPIATTNKHALFLTLLLNTREIGNVAKNTTQSCRSLQYDNEEITLRMNQHTYTRERKKNKRRICSTTIYLICLNGNK